MTPDDIDRLKAAERHVLDVDLGSDAAFERRVVSALGAAAVTGAAGATTGAVVVQVATAKGNLAASAVLAGAGAKATLAAIAVAVVAGGAVTYAVTSSPKPSVRTQTSKAATMYAPSPSPSPFPPAAAPPSAPVEAFSVERRAPAPAADAPAATPRGRAHAPHHAALPPAAPPSTTPRATKGNAESVDESTMVAPSTAARASIADELAAYDHATALVGVGDFGAAADAFAELIANYPDGALRPEAELSRLEALARARRYDDVVVLAPAMLARPDVGDPEGVRRLYGDALVALHRCADARATFADVAHVGADEAAALAACQPR